MKDCKVCLVQHDDEIHAATLSVREWFREEVTQSFYEEPAEVPQTSEAEGSEGSRVA